MIRMSTMSSFCWVNECDTVTQPNPNPFTLPNFKFTTGSFPAKSSLLLPEPDRKQYSNLRKRTRLIFNDR